MSDFSFLTGALPDPIGVGPANLTIVNPIGGNQAPTMETLMIMFLQGQQAQQALLEHLADRPAPVSRKTDYEKSPLYNVPKLKKGVSEAVLSDWVAVVQTGDVIRQYCAHSDRINWVMT